MIPEQSRGSGLYVEHIARYRFAAALARGRRVLDCACGTGYGSWILRDAGALDVIGADIDPAAVEYARAHFSGEGIRYLVDDAARLERIEDRSIDLYVCLETIEHIADGEALIRAAARVLKPNGIFLCSTPNWEVSRVLNPFHVKELTLAEFRALLSIGFSATRFFLQRNYLATRIAPGPLDGEAKEADGRAPVLGADDLCESPEEAPYFLAAAGNEPLPELMPRVDLGPPEVTERDRRYIQNLEGGVAERDRAIAELAWAGEEARTLAGALREGVAEREGEIDDLKRRLEEQETAHAVSIEERNRYIQNLEGGVRERDDRIRDLEIAGSRREMILALRLIQAGIRVNRLFGKIPTRAYRFLRDRWKRRAAAAGAPGGGAPFFSIIVPVYNHSEYLKQAIESALGQTFADFECVLYDDASTEPEARGLLEQYAAHERAHVIFGDRNRGLSGALNQGIAHARGEYLAFLDCDDLLDRDALRKAAAVLAKEHKRIDVLYTNRLDIDERGAILRFWDFRNRAVGSPEDELLKGMFCSHLKVIRREAFRRTGLYRSEYDSAQDYDMALRLSEGGVFRFLPENLYRHRVHRGQATQGSPAFQEALAAKAREASLVRRSLARGEFGKRVSIVILSLNRVADTKRCVEAVARHTPLPHDVLVVDNGSTEEALRDLRALASTDRSFRLHEAGRNLGCGGGRNLGVEMTGGEYLVFLDNDIEVSPRWLEKLLAEMETDERLAACCCRVIFPDGRIQYNGGAIRRGARRIRFDLIDTGKNAADLSSLETHDCDWIPGGATIFRREALVPFPYDTMIAGAYEDNDWSMRVRAAGYRLKNAPLAAVVHHHMDFDAAVRRDRHYLDARYNKATLERTLLRFYRKHGVFIDEEDLYRYLGYEGSEAFIERHAPEKRIASA
jgi:GT2 family glycosyltransferase/ubiquinone/menaquinone biosynthesis C-methylase UbiE